MAQTWQTHAWMGGSFTDKNKRNEYNTAESDLTPIKPNGKNPIKLQWEHDQASSALNSWLE